jgi:glucosamine-phosphate N-acetyltransferase
MRRFNPNPNGKLIRTFFSNSLDVAPSAPTVPPKSLTPLLEADTPLFSSELISQKVCSHLPSGYSLRPLCRSDYNRGFMDVARIVGKTGCVEEDAWDTRCEWLEQNKETYFIVVVLDYDDIVVASGTLLFERKLWVLQYSTIA